MDNDIGVRGCVPVQAPAAVVSSSGSRRMRQSAGFLDILWCHQCSYRPGLDRLGATDTPQAADASKSKSRHYQLLLDKALVSTSMFTRQ